MDSFSVEYANGDGQVEIRLRAPQGEYLYALAMLTRRFFEEVMESTGSSWVQIGVYPDSCLLSAAGVRIEAPHLLGVAERLLDGLSDSGDDK